VQLDQNAPLSLINSLIESRGKADSTTQTLSGQVSPVKSIVATLKAGQTLKLGKYVQIMSTHIQVTGSTKSAKLYSFTGNATIQIPGLKAVENLYVKGSVSQSTSTTVLNIDIISKSTWKPNANVGIKLVGVGLKLNYTKDKTANSAPIVSGAVTGAVTYKNLNFGAEVAWRSNSNSVPLIMLESTNSDFGLSSLPYAPKDAGSVQFNQAFIAWNPYSDTITASPAEIFNNPTLSAITQITPGFQFMGEIDLKTSTSSELQSFGNAMNSLAPAVLLLTGDIGPSWDQFDFSVALKNLVINKDVSLPQIVLSLSKTNALITFSIDGSANIHVSQPAQSLVAFLSGEFSTKKITITASYSDSNGWAPLPDHPEVVLNNIAATFTYIDAKVKSTFSTVLAAELTATVSSGAITAKVLMGLPTVEGVFIFSLSSSKTFNMNSLPGGTTFPKSLSQHDLVAQKYTFILSPITGTISTKSMSSFLPQPSLSVVKGFSIAAEIDLANGANQKLNPNFKTLQQLIADSTSAANAANAGVPTSYNQYGATILMSFTYADTKKLWNVDFSIANLQINQQVLLSAITLQFSDDATDMDIGVAADCALTKMEVPSSLPTTPSVIKVSGKFSNAASRREVTFSGEYLAGAWTPLKQYDSFKIDKLFLEVTYDSTATNKFSAVLSGTMVFGDITTSVSVDLPAQGAKGAFAFLVELEDSKSLDLTKIPGIGSQFPAVKIDNAVLSVSTYSGSFDIGDISASSLPSQLTVNSNNMITIQKGISIYADFDLEQNTIDSIATVKQLSSDVNSVLPAVLLLTANIGASTSNEWDVAVSLINWIINDDVTISKTYLQLQSASPQFSIGCAAVFKHDGQTLNFNTVGTFGTDSVKFSGTAVAKTEWRISDDISLKNMKLQIDYSKSASYKITSVLVGNAEYTWHQKVVDLGVSLKLPYQDNGTIAFYVERDSSSNLASLFPGVSLKLDIELDEVVLIVASYSGSYTFPQAGQFPSVNVLQGLNFVFKVQSDKLVAKNAALSDLISTPTTYVFVGSFSKNAWSFSAEIDNLVLSSSVFIKDCTLTLQDIPNKPEFEFGGDMVFDSSAYAHMNVQVQGDFSSSDVSLSGAMKGSWTVPGAHSIVIHEMSLLVDLKFANKAVSSTTFKITGTALFGDYSGSCSIALESQETLSFTLEVDVTKVATNAAVVSAIGESKAQTLQADSFSGSNPGKDAMSTYFQSGELKFTYSASTIEFSIMGVVVLWGDSVSIEISASGHKFELSIGIMTLSSFSFGKAFPKLKKLDEYTFENTLLVLSTAKQTVDFQTYKSSTGKPVNVAQGLTFITDMVLNKNPKLKAISQRMDITQLQFEAIIDYDSFTVSTTIDTSWYLSKQLDMYKTVFSFTAKLSGVDVALQGFLKYSSKHQTTPIDFNFSLELGVGTSGAAFTLTASMTTSWNNAFGFRGIDFDKAEILAEIGVGEYELGLGGQVDIHGTKAEIDGILGDFELVYIEIDQMHFGDLLSSVTPVSLNAGHKFIDGISIQELMLEVSDFTSTQTFDKRSIAPGFSFKANNFDFFNYFKGSVDATVSTKGMALNVDIAPLDIFKGNIKFSGYDGKAIIFDLTLMEGEPINFEFSGKIELFHVVSFGCFVKFANDYFQFDVSVKIGHDTASLMLTSGKDKFTAKAELDGAQMQQHIEDQLAIYVNEIYLAAINTTGNGESEAERQQYVAETASINEQIAAIVSNNLNTIGKDFTEVEKEIYYQQVAVAKLVEIYDYISYEVDHYETDSNWIGTGCLGVAKSNHNCKCTDSCKKKHFYSRHHECSTTCGGGSHTHCESDNSVYSTCKHLYSVFQALTDELSYAKTATNQAYAYLKQLEDSAPKGFKEISTDDLKDLLNQLATIQLKAKAFQASDKVYKAVLQLLDEITKLDKTAHHSKIFSVEKAYIEGDISPGDYKLVAYFDGYLFGHHDTIDFEVDFKHLWEIPFKLVEEVAKKSFEHFWHHLF